jgi:BlaI family penicillinase repressor
LSFAGRLAVARFTAGELEVMRVLWRHGGEMKPPEVRDAMPRPIKDPALRSYLTILLDKGHVSRRRVGRAYYYRAVTPSESAFAARLRALVDTFCNGSTKSLVRHLIKAEQLSEDELIELKQLAEAEDEAPADGERGEAVE